MIVDFRRNPPAPPPPRTIMNSTVTGVEPFRFLGTTIFQDLKWDNHIKGPAEAVLPSPAEEVQPATGAANIVLLCHHWIRPLHINNDLVQHSYQISPQKTMEGSPDCWANHWYNPPHSPRTVPIQSEKKGWQNHSGPLTSSTLTLLSVTVWSTLQNRGLHWVWAPAGPNANPAGAGSFTFAAGGSGWSENFAEDPRVTVGFGMY